MNVSHYDSVSVCNQTFPLSQSTLQYVDEENRESCKKYGENPKFPRFMVLLINFHLCWIFQIYVYFSIIFIFQFCDFLENFKRESRDHDLIRGH